MWGLCGVSCMLKALGLGVANNPRQSDRTPTTDIVRVQRAQAPPLSMHISTSTICVLRTQPHNLNYTVGVQRAKTHYLCLSTCKHGPKWDERRIRGQEIEIREMGRRNLSFSLPLALQFSYHFLQLNPFFPTCQQSYNNSNTLWLMQKPRISSP